MGFLDFDADLRIQNTNEDALSSKWSAVQAGYLNDSFVKYMIKDKAKIKRPPIINRGTYIRTVVIDKLIYSFLRSINPLQKKQIISFGAGSDTRYFNIMSDLGKTVNFIFHELDFPVVTKRKASIISKTPALYDLIHSSCNNFDDLKIDLFNGSILSPSYCLHPIDLRTLTSIFSLPKIDNDLPTLILSECCLVYLEPHEADQLIQWCVNAFASKGSGIVIYEPIKNSDSFGKMMVKNLASRGISFKTLDTYSTTEKQCTRLYNLGFTTYQKAISIKQIFDEWSDHDDKIRISKVELLDEVEEWNLLASHYCVAWGWIDEHENGYFNEWATF
ncbi:leucine carboxy methyltransferase [Pneumocystis jirovecii RU7]|uniref:Leucine carboxyl methyltransferase 1 n=1 Tax=Pneumocystis jirovecii (strain RU7) TaxID=1408657 RepID=A0A0W4ZRV5_PNEJ7|nr:leucine carboxy methyltransferase [Pneumocystis jirovecii RU7]KTW31090.1 hypothetical protein T551_01642 [Pneumocystis jirovecii RU7]